MQGIGTRHKINLINSFLLPSAGIILYYLRVKVFSICNLLLEKVDFGINIYLIFHFQFNYLREKIIVIIIMRSLKFS